ncbi:MAG: MbnP family protein [Saprospiraceae bacterium]
MRSLLTFLFAVLVANCFAQKAVMLHINTKVNGEPFAESTTYTVGAGQKVVFTRVQMYLSQFTFTSFDGDNAAFKESVILYNAKDLKTDYLIGSTSLESIQSMTFSTGIDPVVNHGNPAQYPAGDPLALQVPSMHWGWSGGYIFMVVEGLYDQDGDGVPESVFQYHTIGDEFFIQNKVDAPAHLINNSFVVDMNFDLGELLDALKINLAPIQHGGGEYIQQIFQNIDNRPVFTGDFTNGSIEVSPKQNSFSFYPNSLGPNDNTIHVQADNSSPWIATLIDTKGNQIWSQASVSKQETFELPDNLNPGLYFLKFMNRMGAVKTLKLIKQ